MRRALRRCRLLSMTSNSLLLMRKVETFDFGLVVLSTLVTLLMDGGG